MDNLRPGQIAVLIGGVLVFVSTFMDWVGGSRQGWNVYDSDTGILLLLLALDLIATAAIRSFAPQVKLPDQILGFNLNELALMAGFAAMVWGLSIATTDGSEGGAVLGFLGGLVATIGAIVETRADSAPAPEAPRTI